MNIIPFYKKVGETPLGALERFRKSNPEFTHLPMTYAGRLDPLVEGLLILLAGDECMKKDEYTSLPKEYELTILFGFSTDTYDLLGRVQSPSQNSEIVVALPSLRGLRHDEQFQNSASGLLETLKKFTGKIIQKYPPYSSRTVNGKPLWKWAREGKLSEIEVPTHEVMVYSIDVKKSDEITGKELLNKIKKVVPLVRGDFRQEEILSAWEEKLMGREDDIFPIVKIVVNAGGGTYMRVIANDIGEALGIPALAYHIKRTKIGEYKV